MVDPEEIRRKILQRIAVTLTTVAGVLAFLALVLFGTALLLRTTEKEELATDIDTLESAFQSDLVKTVNNCPGGRIAFLCVMPGEKYTVRGDPVPCQEGSGK